jgi:hypothetical protein
MTGGIEVRAAHKAELSTKWLSRYRSTRPRPGGVGGTGHSETPVRHGKDPLAYGAVERDAPM